MTEKQEKKLFFGEVLKTFGTGGGLMIKLSPDAPEELDTKEPLFITIDGLAVPFFIKTIAYKGNHKAHVIFDDMETDEAAKELIGKKIYFISGETPAETTDELAFFIGFTLQDVHLGELGEVTDFFDYPGNPCFQCFYQSKELLIPVNEDLIEGIDPEKKIILLNLPDGLIDI